MDIAKREEIESAIHWFAELRQSIQDGETESAIEACTNQIKRLQKELPPEPVSAEIYDLEDYRSDPIKH